MKISFALGILCAAVSIRGAELPEHVKKLFEECRKERSLGGSMNLDDPKAKCFLACVMKKKGTLVDNKIVIDKEIELAIKNQKGTVDKEAIKQCATRANVEKDECEVAAALQKCIAEKPFPFE